MSDGRRDPEMMAEIDREVADTEMAYDAAYEALRVADREHDRARDLFKRLGEWREAVREIRVTYMMTHREIVP